MQRVRARRFTFSPLTWVHPWCWFGLCWFLGCVCWLAHTCLCAVTITNVSRHLCEEVTSLEVGWIMLLEHSCLLLSLARGSFWYKCPLCTFDCENFSQFMPQILLDTSTGLQVRHRKTGGGRERAAAAGSISLWPEPPRVAVTTAICCKLCFVGFISGSTLVLWLLLW